MWGGRSPGLPTRGEAAHFGFVPPSWLSYQCRPSITANTPPKSFTFKGSPAIWLRFVKFLPRFRFDRLQVVNVFFGEAGQLSCANSDIWRLE
jgi:hypothetical protein